MARFLLRRLLNYAVLVAMATTLGYFLAGTTLHPRANYEGRNPPLPAAVMKEVWLAPLWKVMGPLSPAMA